MTATGQFFMSLDTWTDGLRPYTREPLVLGVERSPINTAAPSKTTTWEHDERPNLGTSEASRLCNHRRPTTAGLSGCTFGTHAVRMPLLLGRGRRCVIGRQVGRFDSLADLLWRFNSLVAIQFCIHSCLLWRFNFVSIVAASRTSRCLVDQNDSFTVNGN